MHSPIDVMLVTRNRFFSLNDFFIVPINITPYLSHLKFLSANSFIFIQFKISRLAVLEGLYTKGPGTAHENSYDQEQSACIATKFHCIIKQNRRLYD